MSNDKEKSKLENKKENDKQEKSDPGTTNSPDPQENMTGPVSSLMHKIEETFKNKQEDKPEDE